MSYYRRQEGLSSVKWWLTAGCCGFLVTLSFVGVTLWLGINVRQDDHFIRDNRLLHQQQLHQHNRKQQLFRDHRPTPEPEDLPISEPEDIRPPPPPPPPPRTFKTANRARIEMVKPSDIAQMQNEQQESSSPTRFRLPLPEAPPQNVKPDEEEKRFTDQRTFRGNLETGRDPGYTTLDESFGGAVNSDASTKKKSEAIYPNWYGLDSIARSGSADEPENRVAHESIAYEIPESSQADASNIPEFTYIKDIPEVPESPSQHLDKTSEPQERENPLLMFLRKRIQDLYDWLTAGSKVQSEQEWLDLLKAINRSISDKNVSVVVEHLRRMYNETASSNIGEWPVSSLIYQGSNGSTNPVSFGLLAIDLFLLHNVQQIAWNEERSIGERMLNDPDVVAMSALFLPPERVQRLRTSGSRYLEPSPANLKQSFVEELLELLSGGLRAVLNLSRAYRSSATGQRSDGVSPLDCVWTLYCRNLEKTASLQGPYGFLAKINRLGLRLLMGEFPVENALENLVKEATQGWQAIHCDKLFPRCGAEEAKDVVLETAMGGTPVQ